MKHLSACLLPLFILSACNSNPEKPTVSNQETQATEKQTCYTSTSSQDTVLLQLQQEGTTLTGKLEYRLFEKDKNTGKLTGKFYGDTLLATYTFLSEGTESVREVAFLRKDSLLLEGYGEVEVRDDSVFFKNRNRLKYGDGIILKKTSCP